MEVNILGTIYSIAFSDGQYDPKLTECDGYCDNTIKKCVVINCDKKKKTLCPKAI